MKGVVERSRGSSPDSEWLQDVKNNGRAKERKGKGKRKEERLRVDIHGEEGTEENSARKANAHSTPRRISFDVAVVVVCLQAHKNILFISSLTAFLFVCCSSSSFFFLSSSSFDLFGPSAFSFTFLFGSQAWFEAGEKRVHRIRLWGGGGGGAKRIPTASISYVSSGDVSSRRFRHSVFLSFFFFLSIVYVCAGLGWGHHPIEGALAAAFTRLSSSRTSHEVNIEILFSISIVVGVSSPVPVGGALAPPPTDIKQTKQKALAVLTPSREK
eukprot:gene996-591_t